MIQLSNKDKMIINLLSEDLPLHPAPFSKIARRAGVSTGALFAKIREYKKKGLIRRFGAVLNHTRLKSASMNAMAVWVVPEKTIEKMGRIASSFAQVSHCYQRKVHPEWKYNFYTMIHGNSLQECKKVAGEIAKKIGINNYKLLVTLRQYKKSIPRYFEIPQ